MNKLLLPTVLATVTALAPVSTGSATTPEYVVTAHVEFGGGSSGPFWVGDPVMISVSDRHHNHPKFTACWTPAPIDRPSCSGNVGAPSAPGTTTVKIKLTGKNVTLTKELKVEKPNSSMSPNKAANKHHLISTVICDSPVLYGNYNPKRGLHDALPASTVKQNDRVGWKYNYDKKVAQVFIYRTLKAGFILRSCLSPNRSASPKT